ncbi:acyl-CoA dehydrogenase [Saccharopolyspora sp. NPDC049426]|uniref:acyl-CoA dehydrogenase n=1 Tax=Saccharopolyspora sp. NPDC049426 TaxID=3155652 RepID=UPI00344AF7F2
MSIAINEDHRLLAETASDLLARREARGASRALLEFDSESLPAFWQEAADLGWLGLHLPEEHGGAGFGLAETAIVAEQMGRAVAPGPFAPTAIASALIDAVGDEETKIRFLPGLADGSVPAGIALDARLEVSGGTASGSAPAVLGGGLARLLVLPAGDDVVVVEVGEAVSAEVPANLDPSRRSARVSLDGAPAAVLAGGRRALVDLARVILSAEAVGVARECTELAAAYAREREQFGRVIGTFQAVKHHCANMAVATELATSAVWDAARAAETGGDQLTFAAAAAAALAAPAADLCANLTTQVHGGIAITWEHDAHLYVRRATMLRAILSADEAAGEVTALTRQGVTRARTVELPPEAEDLRAEVRAVARELAALPEDRQKERLIETGYVMPHWPEPYGRAAGAVEQLVVEQEFASAGVQRPQYGITGWVVLTLIQHGTEQQVSRWVGPALRQDVIWCQLFSEPAAGSDAAGIKTRATRVDGGWLVNGQKVWTSGAHKAGKGFATVRTDPEVPKHQGITMMVIDMRAEGVDVRPIKMPSGASEFNEVFFQDVFVPDEDVVGPINGGWTVARATLGNESVSIGGGQGTMSTPASAMVPHLDAHPDRLTGGAVRIGRYAAEHHAMEMLNVRSAHRAVAGDEPGPEGAITKLVLSELGHEAAAIMNALSGPEAVYLDGPGAFSGALALLHRGLSIAGGTSEIKRNQIGERILGLPRDPLIK